jgi:hypothetical protein
VALSFSARVIPAPEVMFRTVGDEALLLNLKSQFYMGLNAVGTRMWILLTEMESVQHGYEALLAEYEVEAEQLRRDLQEFVDELEQNGLIEILPAGKTTL